MYAHHLRRWSTLSQHQFNILCLPNNTYLSLFTDQARLDQVETMLREACMLKGQWHTNINPLLAACMDDPHRPLLVFAHTDQGNLKRFLQRCKISDVASSQVRRTCALGYKMLYLPLYKVADTPFHIQRGGMFI